MSGDLEALNSFASTDANQGTGKWIGIDINTGLDTIEGAKWDSYTLTAADVAEAASVGLGAGHIIFWAKAENLKANPRTVTISKTGSTSVTITVSFNDTHVGD